MKKNQIDFRLLLRCSIYPRCYLVPIPQNCYRIQASGISCKDCEYQIHLEDDAKHIQASASKLMDNRVKKHYKLLESKLWKKKIRPNMLEYDHYTCAICKKSNNKNMHVHHILRFSGNEDLTPRNLVVLCQKCHIILEGLIPTGMLELGWPEINIEQLRSFHNQVVKTSQINEKRFRAPLECYMIHVCFICKEKDQCPIGIDTQKQIDQLMEFTKYDKNKQSRLMEKKIINTQTGQKSLNDYMTSMK